MSAWKKHSEHTVYSNPWLSVNLADVELPDGRHLDHYLLRQRPVASTAIIDESQRVLLLWRHRFIPDTWGWELPSGVVDQGEDPEITAKREAEEETGWQVEELEPLLTLHPASGLSDCIQYVFWTTKARYIGPPVDDFESDRIQWVPLKEAADLIDIGKIQESNAVSAILRLQLMLA